MLSLARLQCLRCVRRPHRNLPQPTEIAEPNSDAVTLDKTSPQSLRKDFLLVSVLRGSCCRTCKRTAW